MTNIRLPLPAVVQRLSKHKPEVLAERVRKALVQADKFARRSMEAYVTAGEYLAALREAAPHGVWADTLQGLGLTPSTGDRLLLLGMNSDIARAMLQQDPDMPLRNLESSVRAARSIPLEDKPNDMEALVKTAIEEAQVKTHTRKSARRGSDMLRGLRKAFDAVEEHMHLDGDSPEVASALTFIERKLKALQGQRAEDIKEQA